jgi:PEP-CTERM motif
MIDVSVADHQAGVVDGRKVVIAPLLFDGMPRFCLSPDLPIKLGDQPYVYTLYSLMTATSAAETGRTLDTTQIGEIGALVRRGLQDYHHAASGVVLAADAATIWEVEGATVVAKNPAVTALIATDLAWVQGRSANVATWTDFPDAVQNVAGAPEPASWALMLAGVGLMGAMLRRSHRPATSRP